MIERAPLGIGLGGQRIELFGRREVFFPLISHQLALLEHMHEFDARQRALCGLENFEPQHRTRDPLYRSMVLLHHIVEKFDLARCVLKVGRPTGGEP